MSRWYARWVHDCFWSRSQVDFHYFLCHCSASQNLFGIARSLVAYFNLHLHFTMISKICKVTCVNTPQLWIYKTHRISAHLLSFHDPGLWYGATPLWGMVILAVFQTCHFTEHACCRTSLHPPYCHLTPPLP